MSLDNVDYMDLARFFGSHSTCERLHVGAVIVRDKRVIVTGYNGAPSGLLHCEHDDLAPCTRAVHAEANAIAFAAKHGLALDGSVLYTTTSPCVACAQLIINAGIKELYYDVWYRDNTGLRILDEAGIKSGQVNQSRMSTMSLTPRD